MKRLLKGLLEGSGSIPSLFAFHPMRALELIAKGSDGQGRLSEELKVGEGATRTLISRLNARLIIIFKPGCPLSKEGETLVEWSAGRRLYPY